MPKEYKLGNYKVKVRWGWVITGIASIVFGLFAIIGPGVDIERLDELEGTVEGYGDVKLGDIEECYELKKGGTDEKIPEYCG